MTDDAGVHSKRGTLRAVVVSGPGDVQIERRVPKPLGPADARVRVMYAGLCHTDRYILSGRHPAARYPLVPGHELAGVVTDVGEHAGSIGVGECVAVMSDLPCTRCDECMAGASRGCVDRRQFGTREDGGWQEELVVPGSSLVALTGTQLSPAEGALLEPAANGVAAVSAAGTVADESVVVIGPGPIGLLAAQCAQAAGARSVTLVGLPHDDQRLALARALGLDAVVIRLDAPVEDIAADLRQRLPGRGADVVIQCAGAVVATRLALAVVSDGGRVVVEGFAANDAPVEISPDEFATRRLGLVGVNGWTPTDFEQARRLAAGGHLRLGPLATHIVALEDFPRALELATDYADGVVKVLFNPTADRTG